MNRAEKIKYLESLLSGNENLTQAKLKWIEIRQDGIYYKNDKEYILITEEKFHKINGDQDVIFLNIPMPDYKI
jgi:hypothetical protein